MSTAALDAFVAALDASDQEIQTVMLLRHGHVVLEEEWSPYRLADPHLLFSVSKSFTSTAIGLAIEAGLLSLDDTVVSFFEADELPETISDNLAAMTIRHLLTMTTGHGKDTVEALSRDRRMVKIFLGLDVEHEPGTVFVYNSGATYMLSAILQRLTGETLLDYLRPRLFEPLGATEATWQVSTEGITTGGWGLSLNTESLARFGQLLLQRGAWEGKQLVPAEWYEAATSRQVPNDNEENPDWQQGYGFQFWRGRHNTYRGDGAFGQFCLIFPEYDAALIVTSAHRRHAGDPEHRLGSPAPRPRRQRGGRGRAARAAGARRRPSGPAPSGGNGRTYRFADERGRSGSGPVGCGRHRHLHVRLRRAGRRRGARGRLRSRRLAGANVASACSRRPIPRPGSAWSPSAYADGDTFVATIRFVETPFVLTLACHPAGDTLTIDVTQNVSFGPTSFTLTSVGVIRASLSQPGGGACPPGCTQQTTEEST